MAEYIVTEWIYAHCERDHTYIELPDGLTEEQVEQKIKDWHWQQVKDRFDWQKVVEGSTNQSDIDNDLPF